MRETEIKTKCITKILSENGFNQVRSSGSHRIWSDGKHTISVTSPTVNRMVARRIMKSLNQILSQRPS